MRTFAVAAFLVFGLTAAAEPPSTPAESEADVWALARKADTVAAYGTYLQRFSSGPHREAALAAYQRLQGTPAIFAPPPPPPLPLLPRPAGTAWESDPCYSMLSAQLAGTTESAEARLYRAAVRTNRPVDFQTYLSTFPDGACRPQAASFVERRAARKALYAPIPGLGPLAAHLLSKQLLTPDDYPASALRAEHEGRTEAEWDVAEDGYVESCRIVRSSGSTILDNATCRLVTARLRYDPARDAGGAAIRSTGRVGIFWTIGGREPPAPRAPPAPTGNP